MSGNDLTTGYDTRYDKNTSYGGLPMVGRLAGLEP